MLRPERRGESRERAGLLSYDAAVAAATEPTREGLEDRFLVAAGLIVLSIITSAVGGDNRIGQVLLVVVESVTLLVILHASQVKRRTRRAILLVVVAGVFAAAVSLSFDRQSVAPGILGAALAFIGPVVIVRRIRHHARIDLETVAASLCIYLLFGLFFSYVYRIIGDVDGQFFVQKTTTLAVDYIYFSFVTLTTTGYGDLTAATNLGKMIAVSEALLGQLYLVSVVALLVGNLGRVRQPVRPFAATDDDDALDVEDDVEDDGSVS